MNIIIHGIAFALFVWALLIAVLLTNTNILRVWAKQDVPSNNFVWQAVGITYVICYIMIIHGWY
jgi:hypothetical protein